jgi:hypothetical protein
MLLSSVALLGRALPLLLGRSSSGRACPLFLRKSLPLRGMKKSLPGLESRSLADKTLANLIHKKQSRPTVQGEGRLTVTEKSPVKPHFLPQKFVRFSSTLTLPIPLSDPFFDAVLRQPIKPFIFPHPSKTQLLQSPSTVRLDKNTIFDPSKGFVLSNDRGVLEAYKQALKELPNQKVTVTSVGNGDTLSLLCYPNVSRLLIVDKDPNVLLFHQIMCDLLRTTSSPQEFIEVLLSPLPYYTVQNWSRQRSDLESKLKEYMANDGNFLRNQKDFDTAKHRLLAHPPEILYLHADICKLSVKEQAFLDQTGEDAPNVVNVTNASEHIGLVPTDFIDRLIRLGGKVIYSSPLFGIPCGTLPPVSRGDYERHILDVLNTFTE